MLILKPFERCPHAYRCPYSNTGMDVCRGDDGERKIQFVCNFYQNDGTITPNKYRNSNDYSGSAKILYD